MSQKVPHRGILTGLNDLDCRGVVFEHNHVDLSLTNKIRQIQSWGSNCFVRHVRGSHLRFGGAAACPGNVLRSCCERKYCPGSRDLGIRSGGAFVRRSITSQVSISINVKEKVIQSVLLSYVTCQGLFDARVNIAHEPVESFIAEGGPFCYPRRKDPYGPQQIPSGKSCSIE